MPISAHKKRLEHADGLCSDEGSRMRAAAMLQIACIGPECSANVLIAAGQALCALYSLAGPAGAGKSVPVVFWSHSSLYFTYHL